MLFWEAEKLAKEKGCEVIRTIRRTVKIEEGVIGDQVGVDEIDYEAEECPTES